MKILSAETNLGSATNVSNAPVVRLFNSGTCLLYTSPSPRD